MTWREHAAPIIAQVLKENEGQDEKAIRKALREAYPFGALSHHPYKVWCEEIRVQRFGKKSKPRKQKGQPVGAGEVEQLALF